jgi:hypothetical protein
MSHGEAVKKRVLIVFLLSTGIAMAETPVQNDVQEISAGEVQTGPEQEQTREAPAQADNDAKVISGMSILGNQDMPKSLVIVPWKSSELGNSRDITTMLDDSRQPVDKEVFMRALRYYEIRSETKP